MACSSVPEILSNKPVFSTMWYQQVFALDAKYNTQRTTRSPLLGMLYIRRRNQLLKEKFSRESKVREQYLKLRMKLLLLRYGDAADQNTCSIYGSEEEKLSIKAKPDNVQRQSIAENFAFAGVHHIFDQHDASVTMIKFANNDKSKLCCASSDGLLSICEAISIPPKVVAFLEGHTKCVTSLDWSISNDLIVSSSIDATIRLWKVSNDSNPVSLRIVSDRQQAPVLSCAFIPVNNNLVVTGNSHGMIQILNISTGIYTRDGSCKMGGKILSITCEGSGGSIIWAGNDKGIIVSFQFELGSGRLIKLQRVQEITGMITSLTWRSWHSKAAPCPVLLVSSGCNLVLLYRIVNHQGCLALWRKYPVKHRHHHIRSTFCPQMGACLIATGSEDGVIHLLDSAKGGKAAEVNKLHGHASPVLALSFNYDESLLASADHQGLIILWRNHQQHI